MTSKTPTLGLALALTFWLSALPLSAANPTRTAAPSGDISNCFQRAPGAVSGVIQDVQTGQPVAGGVQLWRLQNGQPLFGGLANSGADGRFVATNIPEGTYKMIGDSSDSNYTGQWVPGKSSFDQAMSVTVTSGVTTTGIVAGLLRRSAIPSISRVGSHPGGSRGRVWPTPIALERDGQ